MFSKPNYFTENSDLLSTRRP